MSAISRWYVSHSPRQATGQTLSPSDNGALDVSVVATISRRSAFCKRASGPHVSTRHATHALDLAFHGQIV